MSRLVVATVLLCWALIDQVRYVLALDRGSASALEQAAWLNPHDSAVHMRMALLASWSGDAIQAVDHARRAVEAQPDLQTAHQQLARMLLAAQRGDEALVELRTIQSRWPDDPNVLVNLGLLHRRRGERPEAETAWRRAFEVDDAQVRVHVYLAELLAEEGRVEEAVGMYERYLQLTVERGDPLVPDNGEVGLAMVACAELHEALGHYQRADQWLTAADGIASRLSRQDVAERVRAVRALRTAGVASE